MQLVNNFRQSRWQQGVGLIEILIAVLVLSIGFLGIAALQAKSLSDNNSAMMRTQASIAAYSMFDAMRSDRANVLAGKYNTAVTAGSCPASGGFVEAQLRTWCYGFNTAFPPSGYSTSNLPPGTLVGGLAALGSGTNGAIDCKTVGGAASNCSIKITFNDSKATGGSATQTMVFWTQL